MTLGSPEGGLAQRLQEPKGVTVPAVAPSLPVRRGMLHPEREWEWEQGGECEHRQLLDLEPVLFPAPGVSLSPPSQNQRPGQAGTFFLPF